MEPYFSINLPKWPECRVKGETVTREQAAEIIIRTQSFSFCSNDDDFENLLYVAAGAKGDNKWDKVEGLSKEYKCLDLEFLENSRILSSFIGGPHGWVNWNGIIQQIGKNIGKWPSVEDVYNEWVKIAETFPFLTLTCQLFDGEGCEENIKPVVEFNVMGGKVRMSLPTFPLFEGIKTDVVQDYMRDFHNPYRERGCTVEQFQKALEITRGAIKD